MDDSNAGPIAEGGWNGTGKEVRGAGIRDRTGSGVLAAKRRGQIESQDRAGAEGPTAEKRPAASTAKRTQAAQKAKAGRKCFYW